MTEKNNTIFSQVIFQPLASLVNVYGFLLVHLLRNNLSHSINRVSR